MIGHILPFQKHQWLDVPGFEFKGVHVLFSRPMYVAKMQYCQLCGTVRMADINEPQWQPKSK